MANDLNQCNFIGRLTSDPEQKYMPNGDGVCNFSIACNWKSKEKEGAEFVRVVVFGKLSEICAQYLKKASKVFISGKMRTRKWQDKDGKDRYTTEIVAGEMQMLDSRSNADEGRQEHRGGEQRSQSSAPAGGGYDDFDDSIPFMAHERFTVA